MLVSSKRKACHENEKARDSETARTVHARCHQGNGAAARVRTLSRQAARSCVDAAGLGARREGPCQFPGKRRPAEAISRRVRCKLRWRGQNARKTAESVSAQFVFHPLKISFPRRAVS